MNDFSLLVEYMEQGSHAGAKMVGDKENVPQSTTLDDILKINKNSQNLNDAAKQTKSPMPFPITDAHLEKIASVYADISTLIMEFKKAQENPVISGSARSMYNCNQIIEKFNKILNVIEGMNKNMDGLDEKTKPSK